MYKLLPDDLPMKQNLSKAWEYFPKEGSQKVTIRFGTLNLIEVPFISREALSSIFDMCSSP